MAQIDGALLNQLARKYVWWKTPEEAIVMPNRVIAQVMDIGEYEDVQALDRHVGEDGLREVIAAAEAGQFSPRSWVYWHYRLQLASEGFVPPLPLRRFTA